MYENSIVGVQVPLLSRDYDQKHHCKYMYLQTNQLRNVNATWWDQISLLSKHEKKNRGILAISKEQSILLFGDK